MMLNDPVIFSAQLWEFLLVGVLVLAVVIMAVIYIRRLEKGRNEDRAAAIRVGLLLEQNRELLGRVREQIIRDDRYIKDLEKDRHNLTLQVCELKSRVNYYENSTLVSNVNTAFGQAVLVDSGGSRSEGGSVKMEI